MRAKFLLQKRELNGIWSSPYGSGVKFRRWVTVEKFENKEDALDAFHERKGQGLSQWRLTFKRQLIEQAL